MALAINTNPVLTPVVLEAAGEIADPLELVLPPLADPFQMLGEI